MSFLHCSDDSLNTAAMLKETIMLSKWLVRGMAALGLAAMALSAQAAVMYASSVTNLIRGNANLAEFSGFYGGNFPGSFPIALTTGAAQAAVLGAPDGAFVSLPGDEANNPTPSGSAFQWAYVEVSFPTTFGANGQLLIRELGANAEQAQVFIWFQDGGNVQVVRTRPAVGDFADLVVDLAPYAALVAAHGGSFTRVGIGGLDLGGPSKGFDLDSVGVQTIPEPSEWAFLAMGLLAVAIAVRRSAL
jgi:hypothetical protein